MERCLNTLQAILLKRHLALIICFCLFADFYVVDYPTSIPTKDLVGWHFECNSHEGSVDNCLGFSA